MILLNRDSAGVFSNFLRVLDWYWYSYYTETPVCVEWMDGDRNIFEDFFKVKQKVEPQDAFSTTAYVERSGIELNPKIELRRQKIPYYSKYEGYFYTTSQIYHEPELDILRKEMNMIFNHYLEFSNSFLANSFINNDRILGVHLRSPQHYTINIDLNDFYRQNAVYTLQYMEENKYDYVYVASDMNPFFDELKKLLPADRILSINYNRLNGLNDDWWVKNNSLSEEVKNVLIDVVNMTKCSELIGGSGNVFLTTLFLNPDIKFHLYPLLNDKNSY